MLFSQRMGITPIRRVLQIDSMDEGLRTRLWNLFYTQFLVDSPKGFVKKAHLVLYNKIWLDLFDRRANRFPSLPDFADIVESWVFTAKWYEIYDLVQMASADSYGSDEAREFRDDCNAILEKELSGYRFIGERIVKITNEHEIAEIEEAMGKSGNTKLQGVHLHLKSALTFMSDRKEPHYRNSITESISAVEAMAKIITNKPDATLGKALGVIDKKIEINNVLVAGYKKLYGYASSEGGLRHAMIDDPDIRFEDAKYMLVSCSAFINYLTAKSTKAGINFS